jgi:hypothetical protein
MHEAEGRADRGSFGFTQPARAKASANATPNTASTGNASPVKSRKAVSIATPSGIVTPRSIRPDCTCQLWMMLAITVVDSTAAAQAGPVRNISLARAM